MSIAPSVQCVYFADAVHPEHQTKPAFGKDRGEQPKQITCPRIWDNAAYHRCAAVKKWLSRPKCRIHPIQLPPYCLHLNPIERLWAVLHAHVTHNRFYPTQKQFANAILHFFRKTIPEKWHNFRIGFHQKFRVL